MVDWKTTLVILALLVWGLSNLMEHYKKVWRKNRAGVWEIRLVSFGFSVAAVLLSLLLGLLSVPSGTHRWAMGVVYAVVVYFVQERVDMKVVKRLAIVAIDEKLRDYGVTEEQLEKLKGAASA